MLTDSFNRVHDYLRISLTDKCNFRCSYCTPYDFPKGFYASSIRMTSDEIEQIASVFVGLGIKKIRLTGGEPLVRKDAKKIIQLLSKFPVELCITTNGVFADEYVDIFKEAGIQTVNVSLDSLDRDNFFSITRRDEFEKVLSNIHLLLRNNFHIKVNVVVMRGVNDNEILDFVEWTKDFPLHIRFIEFMPFSGNRWEIQKVVSHCSILKNIEEKSDIAKLEDARHDVGKKYKVIGYEGTFALISAITEPFCFDCNRLRLTADGKLRNCLFAKSEIDLLTPFRNGKNIVPLITQCVKEKEPERGGQFDFFQKNINGNASSHFPFHLKNRNMIAIGG